MLWYDWLIVAIPVVFVMWMGIYSRRYLKDVTTFLSAGRVCGRYVISVGDIANALSIIGLLAYVEVHYKVGFALGFWGTLTLPLSVVLGLFGFGLYRFRETKAQSLGQFLELRYSRRFRIFAAALRCLSEMLANMIMPALAARFFIYFLGLPETFTVFGFSVSTFDSIMLLVLTAAISIICMGGTLSIIVTDTIQGFICYPLLALFAVFVLCKFSWSNEILPVLSERAAGENFLNPYDIGKLRDFNYFFLIVTLFCAVFHRCSWIGCGGGSSAAKSAHEQKMASLLGSWRNALGVVFYVLMSVALLTYLTHQDFAEQAHEIRMQLTSRIAEDVVKDEKLKDNVIQTMHSMPVQKYQPGVDKPLSEKENVDTRYLNKVHNALKMKDEAQGNSLFQQFRTLYYQQMLPVTLRQMLPPGMLGLFCLLMILAMISTDDSRIFSATVTMGQDVILPLIKKPLTPRQHMWMIRLVAIGIGVFFFFGSKYMAQLDYINLYVTLVCTMWLGGCGPVMIFGLYGRFGTTMGAWWSLISGMVLAVVGMLVQRNWANAVYPWLADNNLDGTVGSILTLISKPLNPVIVWEMNAVKCPINSYEWYFITMLITLALYCLVSKLTCREPFNLERMLHRGKYAIDGARQIRSVWTWNNVYDKLIGITPEYSFWDKVVAWAFFVYSIIYKFFGCFILIVIWNLLQPWSMGWWGNYFLIVFLVVPGIIAAITAVWFGICGTIDMKAMFRDLNARIATPLDDGRVEGNVSLADKAQLDAIDAGSKDAKPSENKGN